MKSQKRQSRPLSRQKAKTIALGSTRRHLNAGMKEAVAEQNPQALFIGEKDDTTYDAALMGYVGKPCEGIVACYDYEKCCDCLVLANPGWSREDAIEWMEYNVVSAYLGPNSPVFFYAPVL